MDGAGGEARRSLYIDEYGGGVLDVFSYPGGKLMGQIGGFIDPEGECLDKKGDVFVVDPRINQGQPTITEFAHGGTSPIQILSDNDQEPYGCGVDAKTGNLAVVNEFGPVEIYTNAQGSPTPFTDPNMALALWCGYDNQGNLFVDFLNHSDNSEIDELPFGKKTFTKINLSGTLGFPGNIQWDGSHLTVVDAQYQGNNTSAIYQLKISGSTGTILGTTVLGGSEEVFGSWIHGGRVIGPEEGPGFDAVDYWPYPAGGASKRSLSKQFDGVFGAVMSPAQ